MTKHFLQGLSATERDELREGLRAAEAERMQVVRDLGSVPDVVGPAPVNAPARGPVVTFSEVKAYPKGDGDFEFKAAGHAGRRGMRRADAFDVMAARSRSGSPLSEGQVAMGRHYAQLFERHSAGGVKCSSLEASSGGGSGGSFMDAMLRTSRELDRLRERIGDVVVLEVRRDGARRVLMARQVVDAVALEGLTVAQLLRRDGWSVGGSNSRKVMDGLRLALERMEGRRRRSVSVLHVGSRSRMPWE